MDNPQVFRLLQNINDRLSQPIYTEVWFWLAAIGFLCLIGLLLVLVLSVRSRQKENREAIESIRQTLEGEKPQREALQEMIQQLQTQLGTISNHVEVIKTTSAKPQVVVQRQKLPATPEEWAALLQKPLMQKSWPDQTLLNILNETPIKYFISFADISAYQQNNAYATFAAKQRGACLLVPIPGSDTDFAAFPYPRYQNWFEDQKDVLDKIFVTRGVSQSTQPIIQIRRYAVLTKMENPNGIGDVFTIKQRGELTIS